MTDDPTRNDALAYVAIIAMALAILSIIGAVVALCVKA